ncbi:MAG TPA: TraR/DksA family transcriptional regulator [Bryobacteraceae bacterium]|nr:TraR/DksA family transcriptional regulator [Bryobacteraceae bacterium]
MNLEHLKHRLLDKERELTAAVSQLTGEARETSSGEPGDPADEAVSSDQKEILFEEGALEWQTLTQVREALRRMQAGGYGICVDCGRPIEPARLEAVPWTPYCFADQSKHDG